jgi:hypothetical protein
MAKLRLGKQQTSPDAPAHTPRVPQGNAPGSYERMKAHRPDDTSTAGRSTGINEQAENPIDPASPNLSPA